MAITDPFEFGNVGVGMEPLRTMDVAASTDDIVQADIDALQIAGQGVTVAVACELVGNNKVGMGTTGHKLYGGVVAVSPQLDANSIPVSCSVQVTGVCRFKYSGTAPSVGQMVELNGDGTVDQLAADADIAAGGHLGRGMVVAVDTTNTMVDVDLSAG
jgi:hypothetical protein